MDFTRTEAAQDLSGLVRTIVDAVCTPEHQRALDGLDQRFDTELWRKLIDADILSTAAPESLGGGGFGTLEQTAILAALGVSSPRSPTWSRWCSAPVCWPASVPRSCSSSGRRRRWPARRS